MNIVDKAYVRLINEVLNEGSEQKDRTDVGISKQLFGKHIRFDTQGEYAPFIQCRTFSPRISWLEYQWMISGNTDSLWLEDRGVTIWKGNTSREFLDSRGLHHLPVGNVGKSYGYQFRNSNGVDQLKKVYCSLKNDPLSRRHVISIYNVADLSDAPLEPCSHLYEFMYDKGKLHLYQHMRSADLVFGIPYNLAFGYYLMSTLCKALGYTTGEYLLTMTNCHMYANQYDIAHEMVTSYNQGLIGHQYTVTTGFPKVTYTKDINSLDGILSLEYTDLEIKDWIRGPKIGDVKMAI